MTIPDSKMLVEILNQQKAIVSALRGAVEKAAADNRMLAGIMMRLRNLDERLTALEGRETPKRVKLRKRKRLTAKRTVRLLRKKRST